VIDLVVNHHGVKTFEKALKTLSALVQADYPQMVGAHGLGIETGKAEATIKVSPLLCSVRDRRIDQRDGRIGFPLMILSATQSDHDHPAVNVDLRGGQPDPVRAVFQCVL
jgi:hypothetical protein